MKVNLITIYISVATIFFLISLVDLITCWPENVRWSGFFASVFFLFWGVIIIIQEKKM